MMELFHRSMNQVRKSSIPTGQDRKKQGPTVEGREQKRDLGLPAPVTGPMASTKACGKPGCAGCPGLTHLPGAVPRQNQPDTWAESECPGKEQGCYVQPTPNSMARPRETCLGTGSSMPREGYGQAALADPTTAAPTGHRN